MCVCVCIYIYIYIKEVAVYHSCRAFWRRREYPRGRCRGHSSTSLLMTCKRHLQLVNDLAGKISSLSLEFPLKFPPLSRRARPAVLPQARRHERSLNSQKGAQETPWFC